MAVHTPYSQIVGVCRLYLAAAGTAPPAVNATPGASWVELGATEGDQTVAKEGPLEYFYDNKHQGPVKSHRPQEDVFVRGTLVELTLEDVGRLISSVGNVTSAAGPPAVKKLPFRAGEAPTEYALLMRGAADSPYGNYPGQNYFPRGVFEGEFERVRSKTDRDAIEFEYHVLEDDTQADGYEMGWSEVQTS